MGSLSTLRRIGYFLFNHTNLGDPKYQRLLHPLISSVSTFVIYMFIVQQVNQQYHQENYNINFKQYKFLSFILIIYVIFMMIVRYKTGGHKTLYELLWGCNMALISTAYALYKNQPLVVGASMIMVSVDQVLWYVDLLGYLFFKKFPIGVANYLIWPSTTRLRQITSIHHILFIPFCLYLLKKQVPIASYQISCFMTLTLMILSRLLTPLSIIQNGQLTYLNVNLSYELWKDVTLHFLRILDGGEWYKTIPYCFVMWNTGNYLLGYTFLNWIMDLIAKI